MINQTDGNHVFVIIAFIYVYLLEAVDFNVQLRLNYILQANSIQMKNEIIQVCSQACSVNIENNVSSQVSILDESNKCTHINSPKLSQSKQKSESEIRTKDLIFYANKGEYNKLDSSNKCVDHQNQTGSRINFVCLEEACFPAKSEQGPGYFCELCIDEQKHKGHLYCTAQKFNAMVCEYTTACEQTRRSLCLAMSDLKVYMEQCLASFCRKIMQLLPGPTAKQNKFDGHQSRRIWRDIAMSKQPTKCIAGILNLQKQFILEQIEYINQSLQECVREGCSNLDFLSQSPDLMFNPDDMHPGDVGLSLNRSQLETAQNIIRNNHRDVVNLASCRLAFTQTPLTSWESKGFQVQSFNQGVMMGCVNESDHAEISQNYQYQNFYHLIHGIEFRHDSSTILYSKGLQPRTITTNIAAGSIVELVYLSHQRIMAILKYPDSSGAATEVGVQVIATIPTGLPEQAKLFAFAGVAGPGDCIRLVDNQKICNSLALQEHRQGDDDDSAQTYEKGKAKCNHCARVENFIRKQKKSKLQTHPGA